MSLPIIPLFKSSFIFKNAGALRKTWHTTTSPPCFYCSLKRVYNSSFSGDIGFSNKTW
jgi:hypothetical protein